LNHKPADRPPRGELLVEEAFLNRLYPAATAQTWRDKMLCLVEEAGLDLVTINLGRQAGEQESAEIAWWASRTDYFVLALINGLFWQPGDRLSFEEYMMGLVQETLDFADLMKKKKQKALELIDRSLDHGAHGCLIGDDLAHNQGPFVSPRHLDRWIFPGLSQMAETIKKKGGAAFLHSCGNLTDLWDRLLSLGFDGLHGLSPAAGNDFRLLFEKGRGWMALMGGVDLDYLKPEEVEAQKAEILDQVGSGGGYILGSTAGLSAVTPLDSFRALYGV